MQPELALQEAEFLRRDQPPVRDAHAVERAVEIGRPGTRKPEGKMDR